MRILHHRSAGPVLTVAGLVLGLAAGSTMGSVTGPGSIAAGFAGPTASLEARGSTAWGVHSGWAAPTFEEDEEASLIEDPIKFLDRLIDRYRDLRHWREEVRVEQVTVDPGSEDPPLKSVVRLVADVEDDRLTVRSSDLLDDVLDLVGPTDGEEADGASDADLRLLPHLRLRFRSNPLEGFAGPGTDALRPAEVDRVVVDDRELLRMQLRSGESGASDTTFNLFVDPRSMLVERIEGEEWLPGGLHHQTTIQVENRELEEPASPREEMPERQTPSTEDSKAPSVPKAGLSSSV